MLVNLKLSDGNIRFYFNKWDQIQASISDAKGKEIATAKTPVLMFRGDYHLFLSVTWEHGEIKIMMGSGKSVKEIGSSTPNQQPDLLILIKENVELTTPRSDRESPDSIINAVKRRSDKISGWHSQKRNSLPGGKESIRSQLVDALERLSNNLKAAHAGLIEKGRSAAVLDIASILRALVVTGKPIPPLQMYAAFENQPLLVYMSTFDLDLGLGGSAFSYRNNLISSEPRGLCDLKADLDDWLAASTLKLRGKPISNREVLKRIGDTEGAHLSVEIDTLVHELRSASWSHPVTSEITLLSEFLMCAGFVVEHLLQILLVSSNDGGSTE